MSDLRSPTAMYAKGLLLLGVGVLASTLILLLYPDWRVALLLVLAVWGFARAYYFAFYVIEHYIDREYKFAGLWSFVRYVLRRRS